MYTQRKTAHNSSTSIAPVLSSFRSSSKSPKTSISRSLKVCQSQVLAMTLQRTSPRVQWSSYSLSTSSSTTILQARNCLLHHVEHCLTIEQKLHWRSSKRSRMATKVKATLFATTSLTRSTGPSKATIGLQSLRRWLERGAMKITRLSRSRHSLRAWLIITVDITKCHSSRNSSKRSLRLSLLLKRT